MSNLQNLPRLFTLANFDQACKENFENSLLVSPLLGLWQSLREKLSQSKALMQGKVGDLLQSGSFALVVLLFTVLALPQFASDKEGLALISLASLMLFCLGRLLGGKTTRAVRASDMLVLGYFAANVVATFASHYLPESVKGLSKVAIYILSYFLFSASLQTRKRLLTVLSATLFTGLLVSLYGLYQYKIGVAPLATWEDPTVESSGTRIFSTLGNPNLLAGYLIPLAPIAGGLGLAALATTYKWKWLAAIISFGVAALIAVATVLTGSRGGFLALGAMAAVIVLAAVAVLFTRKPKLVLPSLIGIALLVVGGGLAVHFLAPTLEQRVLSIFDGTKHSSNAYRMYVWIASYKMFLDNWWFGVGPGNTAFCLAYGLYMKSGFDALGTYCVPLEVGVECGIGGIFFFFAILACALAAGHMAFWRSTDKVGSALALGLATALVGLMVQGCVDTVFYRPQVHFIFWLIIAALIGLMDQKHD